MLKSEGQGANDSSNITRQGWMSQQESRQERRSSRQRFRTLDMVLRRRTESLLANNTRRNNVPNSSHTNGSSPATADLLLIRRGNVTSWRAFVRLAIVALCLLSIGCIAWAVDNGPKKADHHVWDWQDVPWVLIPVWTSFASFSRTRLLRG